MVVWGMARHNYSFWVSSKGCDHDAIIDLFDVKSGKSCFWTAKPTPPILAFASFLKANDV